MANNYPHHPGAYPIDTALAAAEAIAPSVSYLQKLILGVLRDVAAYGATGDEIAERLGWERFRVRPRTSELRVMRKIVDSGKRRKSQSGINSIVWVLPEYAERKEASHGWGRRLPPADSFRAYGRRDYPYLDAPVRSSGDRS